MNQNLRIDPVLVRLTFVLFTLAGGSGILVYIILYIVMPLDSGETEVVHSVLGNDSERQRRTTMLVGGGMILAGVWFLLGHIPGLAWISLDNLWPLALIAIGFMMIRNYQGQEN